MQIVKVTSQTITRPADTTAYASGDLVANSTTAGSVTPFAFSIPVGRGFVLQRVCVRKSSASVTNATFRLHLYNDSPTVANGDNGAISSIAANYQGFVDVAAPATAFSNTYAGYGVYINNSVYAPMLIWTDTDYLLYGLLEARGAYTPASAETIAVDLLGQAYL